MAGDKFTLLSNYGKKVKERSSFKVTNLAIIQEMFLKSLMPVYACIPQKGVGTVLWII